MLSNGGPKVNQVNNEQNYHHNSSKPTGKLY